MLHVYGQLLVFGDTKSVSGAMSYKELCMAAKNESKNWIEEATKLQQQVPQQ